MKKIMCAILNTNGATDADGNDTEYQLGEINEAEYGRELDGDVIGYVANLDLEDGCEIVEAGSFTIHNKPAGAVIVSTNGEPSEIFWAEEASEEEEV